MSARMLNWITSRYAASNWDFPTLLLSDILVTLHGG